MSKTYSTPGVYIEEKNAFPGSAVAVETAVPVFIGYTEMAERNGVSLIGEPTRITSFAEYVQWFGHGFRHTFSLKHFSDSIASSPAALITKFDAAMLANPDEIFYFYNCIRLFYQNGGSNCYIMSIGTYGEGENQKTTVDVADLPDSVFEKLEKTFEPTMVLIPDFVSQKDLCYALYRKVLLHCQKTQNRIGIFDVIPGEDETLGETLEAFRVGIGSEALNYGAAYYPWLNTSIVPDAEINFNNLVGDRDSLLPLFLTQPNLTTIQEMLKKDDENINREMDQAKKKAMKASSDQQLQQLLLQSSPIYQQVMAEIQNRLNLLPPSAAMAGIYSLVDSTRGVWKSPANISLSMVNSPAVSVSSEQQETMNVDAITGKSINAIRPFPGIGTLVWGARTLDGNSQDWRYINVRRTIIMIEQSLKLACRAYVFEPNDSATWVTIKSTINNFLTNLWKQGALAGAVPEDAFEVQVGLGATMTPTDILDGYLRVTVMLALARPAEFIEITFQQQQQPS